MKKLLLTTAAAAILSSGSAMATTKPAAAGSNKYFKAAMGLNYGDDVSEVSSDAYKSTKRLSGYAAELGAGMRLNDMFGVEAVLDYKKSDKSHSLSDAEKVVAKAAVVKTNANIAAVSLTSPSASYKETSYGLGAKIYMDHGVTDSFSLGAGIGAGVARKSLETTFSTTFAQTGQTSLNLHLKAKSSNITTPFGFMTVGAQYHINEDIAAGLEYNFRFNADKKYKAKNDVKFKKAEAGLADGSTNLAFDTTESIFVNAGDDIGKTSRQQHGIMATLKFGF